MNEEHQFVLVVIWDDSLMGHWTFRAADELAVAQYMLRHPWEYEDVFWALRISLQGEVEHITPAELLQEIHGSYPNNHVRAVVHLFRTTQPADCAATGSPSLPSNQHCTPAP